MESDRRRFFRINDEVDLKIRPIKSDDEMGAINDYYHNLESFAHRNEFNFQLSQHHADLQHVEDKFPELARYLRVMQKEIDRLSEKLEVNEEKFGGERCSVNLSAQGLSLYTHTQYELNTLVDCQLQLIPSHLRIATLARVIICQVEEGSEQKSYLVALDFEHIREAEQEILVKHVHSQQLQQLGANQLDRE